MDKYSFIFLMLLVLVVLAILAVLLVRGKLKSALCVWLRSAVILAENSLGGKTGQLKLQYVYNLAIAKFPLMAFLISFETFKKLVDGALEWIDEAILDLATEKSITNSDVISELISTMAETAVKSE